MITVPDNFQFRIDGEPGYTHSGKVSDGMCKVVWARGFDRYYMDKTGTTIFPNTEWSLQEAAVQFVNRRWMLVVDEAAQEQALPNEFYFSIEGNRNTYKGVVDAGSVGVTWTHMKCAAPAKYDYQQVVKLMRKGKWKIIDKKPLSTEQRKANKEAREQVQALESSIKINQQDIAHKERLIASYEERKQDLLNKIVEE